MAMGLVATHTVYKCAHVSPKKPCRRPHNETTPKYELGDFTHHTLRARQSRYEGEGFPHRSRVVLQCRPSSQLVMRLGGRLSRSIESHEEYNYTSPTSLFG